MNLIILDAGHSKTTKGKVAPDKSLYEWDFNNKIQYKLKSRLENLGFKVCLTNPDPENTSDIALSTRASKANKFYTDNKKPNTIMLSIHANAYGEWTAARGVEVFHASNASQNSKNLAKYICDNIYADIKAIDPGFKNRGVKQEDFTVIYKTVTPCVLVEYGFYTNKEDLKILKNNQSDLIEATIKGICKYFNINYQGPKSESVKTENIKSNTYYRVVAGSYKDRSNAENMLNRLKLDGYSGFISTFEKDNTLYYRAVAGSYSVRSNADDLVIKLKATGYAAFIEVYNK